MTNLVSLSRKCLNFHNMCGKHSKIFINHKQLKTKLHIIPSVMKISSAQSLKDSSENISRKKIEPPIDQCCMEGCVDCVWLKYADSLVDKYKEKLTAIEIQKLFEEIDKDVANPNVRSYIKFEIKLKVK